MPANVLCLAREFSYATSRLWVLLFWIDLPHFGFSTEIRLNNDATSCLSLRSKLPIDKNQVRLAVYWQKLHDCYVERMHDLCRYLWTNPQIFCCTVVVNVFLLLTWRELKHLGWAGSALTLLVFIQCHYAIEEDSEGDNDSEEFYYGGQVRNSLHCSPLLFPIC